MTNKTRKRIWPVALMSLAVFGLLAAVTLSVMSMQTAQAHGCDQDDALARAQCITDHEREGLDPNATHDHDPNQPPVLTGTPLGDVSLRIPSQSDSIDVSVAFEDPDADDELTYTAVSNNTGVATVSINGSMMVISTGAVRGGATITVTAADGNGGTVSITFMVRVAEGYTLTAVPMADPNNPSTYVVEKLESYTAKFDLEVGGSDDDVTVTITATEPPDGGITVTNSNGLISAGFVDEEETDLEGSLTVKAEDDNNSRAFEIEGVCVTPGAKVTITVDDDDLEEVAVGYILCKEQPAEITPGPGDTSSDHFTVASYGDWEYDDVTDGFILDVSNGNDHMVNLHYNKKGLLSRDEPVIHAVYTLGVSNMETLRDMPDGSPRRVKDDPDNKLTRQEKNAYVEEGQRTIEVLAGQPHVQLTVTSMEPSPAYIRFLDSDMQPFGTDVDEEPMWRGADVVGLDSQGRLALNNVMELSAAKALAFDQYSIKTPDITEGQPVGNSYLVGAAGTYNQGAFRFFNPCPEVGHYFYVQVYESTGKYLETTEKILCVPSPKPGPAGLVFEIDSQKPGEGRLTFEPALNAVGHTVLLIDASNRNIVESVTATDPMFNADTGTYSVTFDNLNNGWTYHIVVIAEGAANQYTADAVRDYGVSWLGQADVPLSTDPSAEPTRMHALCMVENADITALLSDCDTEPVPPPELGAPTNVMAVIDETDPALNDIVVTWMDGANADVHHVYLVPTDFDFANLRQERITSGMTHTFMDVAPDTYIVAVQSTSPMTSGYEYAIAPGLITVGGQ